MDIQEILNFCKEIITFKDWKKSTVFFLFSIITLFCTYFARDIFDNMYIGLIKTLCSLYIIFCVSVVSTGIGCKIFDYVKQKIVQYQINIETHKKISNIETEREKHDMQISTFLRSLSPKTASTLRYVFYNRSHAAYLPCNDIFANELYSYGCLESRLKNEVRAWGYKEQTKCFYYRVSQEIASFLENHIKELGINWGLTDFRSDLNIYQRAGKVTVLE